MSTADHSMGLTTRRIEFLKHFLATLETAVRERRIQIAPHKRTPGCLVLMEGLPSYSTHSLDPLRGHYDEIMESMQPPEAQEAAESLAYATPEELGEAALRGFNNNR